MYRYRPFVVGLFDGTKYMRNPAFNLSNIIEKRQKYVAKITGEECKKMHLAIFVSVRSLNKVGKEKPPAFNYCIFNNFSLPLSIALSLYLKPYIFL